ncbi:sulfotransferase family protein [Fodinibius saliphilus]|uniref:sulfotransferase family protein n=1 Tax=Fodinibius saliphilus TaxID=1920650 RepID=UPI0011094EAA|nr:sulfotransferase [Fodinibius saliphilus]
MDQEYKVDFMIVGSQKCGTTTLAEMLRRHPAIVSCDEKEPMFFCSSPNWQDEISDYHSLFQWKKGGMHFESSTSYTFYPYRDLKVWDRLYTYNPDLKIIYIVRHPIDRIISSYMHAYEQGHFDTGLEKTIVKNAFFLNVTRYATQIRPYIDRFGSENVQILFFEDLVQDPSAVVSELSKFLGISEKNFGDVQNIHSNKSVGGNKLHHRYKNPGIVLRIVRRFLPFVWKKITDNSDRAFKEKPQMDRQYQEMVLHLLRNEIDELEQITGRDLSTWRKINDCNFNGDIESVEPSWDRLKVHN